MTSKQTDLPVIAIFDLDYTLTKRGTWGRFVWQTVRSRPHLWIPLLCSTLSFQWQYKRGKIPRGAVKKTMMRWSLLRHDQETLRSMAEAFALKEVNNLRPGGHKALAYHKTEGHQIVIASAAVDLLVEPIARNLEVSNQVSTLLDWTPEGRLKDTFKSPNCYGQAKLERVKSLLNDIAPEGCHTYFYSDSKADLPVLEYVDVPIVVDPSKKFEVIAKSRGFEIQYWLKKETGFMPVYPDLKNCLKDNKV